MLTLLALLCTAQAAPIGVVPLQGVLTDATGTPVEGDVDVLFQLYTDDTGSQSIYSEIVTLATVNGRFAYDLGSTQLNLDLAAFAQFQTIHLGVTVGTDTEMPLVPLSHVPYAAWAEDAAKLGGKTAQETSDDILIETDLRYRALGTLVPWSELTDIPADIADGDADTTYSGADFATSNQGCTTGSVMTGISATGAVICAADAGLTTEADPVYGASPAAGITNGLITNWSAAYGWGDHSSRPYAGTTGDTFTGPVALNAGATVANNPLSINNAGDGNNLLVLNSERAWSFQQVGSGSSTQLTLRNTSGPNKNFNVQTDGNFRHLDQAGNVNMAISPAQATFYDRVVVQGDTNLVSGTTPGQTSLRVQNVATGTVRSFSTDPDVEIFYTGVGVELDRVACTSAQRGRLMVARAQDSATDALCFCGSVSSGYVWQCISR